MPSSNANVRRLVIENQVQAAFMAIDARVSGQVKDHLHLLWTQFNFWEKQSNLGLRPPLEERNRVLFAFFSIISELEENKTLLALETSLSNDYEQLVQLGKNGEIDKLMYWLMENHPQKFRERLSGESKHDPGPVARTFSEAILQQYIEAKGLDILPMQLLRYVTDRMAAIPNFFTEWSAYSEKRQKAIPVLAMKIEYEERRYYKTLLITGILAGIGGGALALFFTRIQDEIHDTHDEHSNHDDVDHGHD